MKYAKKIKANIIGIVSRDGGETIKLANACVWVPIVNVHRITPHAEEWQGIILHLIPTMLTINS